jgi:hypothetical protein
LYSFKRDKTNFLIRIELVAHVKAFVAMWTVVACEEIPPVITTLRVLSYALRLPSPYMEISCEYAK